ncbi:MAG TPA: tail fiber domain-containing protein [Kiritimatiellia bacterium]|nr:tail fiber domain-containing protein [Kiritimatiellia bacterium]HRZ13012.1 tail fiber domain-containing protein [Kiritimatiellia bacterium]HSA18378.1 tail fiber domain-containing protein [Kiritimatiellia bacterium]
MKSSRTVSTAFAFVLIVSFAIPGLSQVPSLVAYQGRLLNGTNLYNGPAGIVFRVYDHSDTNLAVLWMEATSVVQVTDGFYATFIAPSNGAADWAWLRSVPPSGDAWWLEVEINGSRFQPLERMAATPYAMVAGAVTNGAISGDMIGSQTVQSYNIADGTLQEQDFDSGVVSSRVIANGSILFADVNQNGAAIGQIIQWNGAAWTNANAVGFKSYSENGTFVINPSAVGTDSIAQGYATYAGAHYSVVGGGRDSRIEARATNAVIGGGFGNRVGTNSFASVIGGGWSNRIGNDVQLGAIGGGYQNRMDGLQASSVIGGGNFNHTYTGAHFAVIGGGKENEIWTNSEYAVIGGGYGNDIDPLARYSMIGGGEGNSIKYGTLHGVVDGGWNNSIVYDSDESVIGGGRDNSIFGDTAWSVIAGGYNNSIQASTPQGVISGGGNNRIGEEANNAVIAGGAVNVISNQSQSAVISGGGNHVIRTNASYAVIGGGENNEIAANAHHATIPGGKQGRANHPGVFLWADASSISTFASATSNEAAFRCSGGVRFTSGSGAANQTVAWTPGSASWTFSSDRSLKEGFVPVDGGTVLERVATLPIAEWNYIGYEERHIGPMAQDFQAAFPLRGSSDKALNSLDLDGVSLAAIQGLYELLNKKDAEIADLRRRLESIESRLNADGVGP